MYIQDKPIHKFFVLLTLLCSCCTRANADFSGFLELQNRYFFQDKLYPQQLNNQISLAIEPEWLYSSTGGEHLFNFKPFYRWDEADGERSHFDIRELMYIYVGSDWEIHTGIGKVFWGVTESTHLVDIINQTDTVEAVDGEDKLGQPMVKLSLVKDWGIVDAYLLPGFRERTYQSDKGRFNLPLRINQNRALYQDGAKDKHIDFALRWSQTYDDLDIAFSWFDGTSRDPTLIIQQGNTDGSLELAPFYAQITQWGLEAQYIIEDWTLKTELIQRNGSAIDNYWAMNSGFEYTFYGVMESIVDVGWLMEYQYDSRGQLASNPAQNDLFVGTRIAFNDAEGSEVLAGIVQDLENSDTRSLLIEAKMRIGENTKLSIDAWFFSSDSASNLIYNFRRDDFIQLTIQQFF
jgi:hypothetical protein